MAIIPRPYQVAAIDSGTAYLQSGKTGGLEVLPTGSGKSVVIAGIIMRLNDKTIVLQPSKEILKQNHKKYKDYGYDASIYSASAGKKEFNLFSRVVFATIGTVVERWQLFKEFKYCLIDECHLVNPKIKKDADNQIIDISMYADFLRKLPQLRIMGFTATPYRLTNDSYGGSILKFITRTQQRIFRDVVYYVQVRTLFDQGFLCPLVYYKVGKFNRDKIKKNSTGADFNEAALKKYYDDIKLGATTEIAVKRLIQIRKNVLVFVRYIKEAAYMASRIPGAEYVTGEMSQDQRDDILARFLSGKLQTLINCGVVAIGFDYPELETIVLASETMSLAKYYQWCGRGTRIHPNKKNCWIVDMCDNMKAFGKIEDLHMSDQGNGKWVITTTNGRQLTNEYFVEVFKKPTPTPAPLYDQRN